MTVATNGTTPRHGAHAPVHSVLVVDDSAFMRKLIGEMIDAQPDFTVAGFARNGVDALRQITSLNPSVVTLDLEMPQLDGLQVLEEVMSQSPRPIVVLSAGGSQFGDATMRALELGAVDFIKKPSGSISLDLVRIQELLITALRAAVSVDVAKLKRIERPAAVPRFAIQRESDETASCVVVVAASTGGPRALSEILPALPRALPAAVLVAQHMPKEFTPSFASRLDQSCALPVTEARHGEPLRAGHVYIAPGGTHMRIGGSREAPVIALDPNQERAIFCPSADYLFTSAAERFGADVVAVVLTGMGRDGAEGIRDVCSHGGRTLVQDRATSVIYGMPQAAMTVAGPESSVALPKMANAIAAAVDSVMGARQRRKIDGYTRD